MMRIQQRRIWILFQLCVATLATGSECDEIAEAAGSLIQKQFSLQPTALSAHPWDHEIFVVGTHHKAGSHLIRNTMTHIFDMLGATTSCTYKVRENKYVTSLNNLNDCETYPAPIRLVYSLRPDELLKIRQEASAAGSALKGVTIVRDPFEMVVSAYVFHHRGSEPGSSLQIGIPFMGPETGVPEMAKRMLHKIQDMVEVYKIRENDTLVVRYEDFTESPQKWDATVEQILDFLFKDEITELQKREALIATHVEDLNRVGVAENRPEDPKFNHTNDEEEMQRARAALPLIAADVYAELVKAQEVLGYI